LRPESTGPLLLTPSPSALSADEEPGTRRRQALLGLEHPTAGNIRRPGPGHSGAVRAGPQHLPVVRGSRRDPAHQPRPAADTIVARDLSQQLAGCRTAQVYTARTSPGPGGRMRQGKHTRIPRTRTDTASEITRRPLHAGMDLDGPGRPSQAWYREETTPKLDHSCIPSASPGPLLPGPADYALQGRSPGPDNRPTGLARPRKRGPEMGNGIRLIPPLQILSQPRPATAGPGGPRAARTLLRAGHPALSRCR
jgi:hypothetical protein